MREMAELNAELVKHKLESQQKEINELKDGLKELKKDTAEDLEVANTKINKLATQNGRIELMLSNVTEKIENMGKSIDKVAESAGKDQGWRALMTDIVKVVLLILGFFATGKFFF
jgi:predicted nuclease with TOPRIM domain